MCSHVLSRMQPLAQVDDEVEARPIIKHTLLSSCAVLIGRALSGTVRWLGGGLVPSKGRRHLNVTRTLESFESDRTILFSLRKYW